MSPYSDFVTSRVYACLRITCHLHFWQNVGDVLRATAVTRGLVKRRTRDRKVASSNPGRNCGRIFFSRDPTETLLFNRTPRTYWLYRPLRSDNMITEAIEIAQVRVSEQDSRRLHRLPVMTCFLACEDSEGTIPSPPALFYLEISWRTPI